MITMRDRYRGCLLLGGAVGGTPWSSGLAQGRPLEVLRLSA